jgi:hypothetical protein
MLHFGIGCYAFELAADVAEPEAAWASTVESALNALPSVDAVRVGAGSFVSGDEPDEPFEFATTRRLWFHPQPGPGVVSFRIKIPERLQRDLVPWREVECGENFRVQTIYSVHGPSTIVVCLDASATGGNAAVVVVREFLLKHLSGSHGVHLTNLGPSPFHTDCSVEGGSASGFEAEIVERPRGYARHAFRYEAATHASDEEAAIALHGYLSDELGTFYRLVRYRNRRLARAVQVANKAEALIEIHRATGARNNLKRLFGTGRSARNLGLDVLSAEFATARDEERSTAMIERIYRGQYGGPFRSYLSSEATETFPAYLQNAKAVVNLLEGGRTKELEVAIVAAATLLGGAAGAVAALVSGG